MSEYLDRLKQRRDATPPPGNAPNVQSNVSFRKAIDYIEKLENQEAYLLARLKEADEQRIPEELFDGYGVTKYITNNRECVSMPYNVSDVLDAVVRMIKERLGQ